MLDLSCPNCGRAGSIPREKINTRLICKKCHIVFHMNTAGRTLLGEPQIEVPKPAQAHPSYDKIQLPGSLQNLGDLRQNFADLNLKAIAIGLAVLVLGGGIYWLVNR